MWQDEHLSQYIKYQKGIGIKMKTNQEKNYRMCMLPMVYTIIVIIFVLFFCRFFVIL